MNRSVLLGYQWLTALSDAGTGIMLYVAPAFTLRMMGVHAPAEVEPYVSFIGAFVLGVGLSCLYGVHVITGRLPGIRLRVVWLLTAFSRCAVAIYLAKAIVTGTLEPAWWSVAAFDGACVLIQAVGLKKNWIADAL